VSAEFDAGLRQHQLLFPKCRRCHRHHWYPMKRCPFCLSEEVSWVATAGTATIFTTTTVRHAFDAASAADIPYTVILVEFSDAPGIRLVSRLAGRGGAAAVIGAKVESVFDLSTPHPRVLFRVVEKP
jgi:uncharacterized OB-fold protein